MLNQQADVAPDVADCAGKRMHQDQVECDAPLLCYLIRNSVILAISDVVFWNGGKGL